MAPPATLVEALTRLPRGTARGFRFITSDGSERYFPYVELETEARRRAGLLASLGIEKGDRIALVIPEGHEFVLSFLAAVMAGAVPVPIFPRASFKAAAEYVDTVAHIAQASRAALLLCADSNHALIEPAKAQVASLQSIRSVERLFAPELSALSFTPPALDADDVCFLQFTSGSTSRPKGVMVTHRNLISNASAFLGPHGLNRNAEDVGVSWLPLYHDMGLIGFILGPLIVDIPVVILPTATFARGPRVWLETLSKYRGTITYAPNFAYGLAQKRLKAKDVESLDLSALRVAGCGAEPIHAETLRSFARALAPAGFRESALLPSYGMAESTLAITFHQLGTPMQTDRVDGEALTRGQAVPSDVPGALEIVSCGVPFPDHELKVVGPGGDTLPERQVGEIWARGPSVAQGYFENPEATAESFAPEGWLRTGDLGYLAGGDLYICGRKKDLIILRGANYHPQDIEWPLGDLPGVRRGNVVAFSVPITGEERLILAVECASGDAADVCARVTARVNESLGLAPHEVVAVTIGSLPKTSSGKIQRSKARGLYLAEALERHVSP
jgi:fatty-acyl-CoA synthase